MPLIRLETQEQLEQLIASIDWEEAFVREAYIISPTYIENTHRPIAQHNALPDMWMSIFTPENTDTYGIEFHFQRVEKSTYHFRQLINPVGKMSPYNHSIEFGVTGNVGDIQAEVCLYRLLTEDKDLGNTLRYGNYKFSI